MPAAKAVVCRLEGEFQRHGGGVQGGEQPEEEQEAPDAAFEGERGQFFDAAENEPQAKNNQGDGKQVQSPAEDLREEADQFADDRTAIDGEQAE